MPVLCISVWCTLEISDCTYTTHFLFDAGEYTGNPAAWTRLIHKRCGEETKRDACIRDSAVAAVNVPVVRHHLMICWWGRLYSFTHLVIFLQMFLVVSDSCSQNSNWVETKTEGLSDHTATFLGNTNENSLRTSIELRSFSSLWTFEMSCSVFSCSFSRWRRKCKLSSCLVKTGLNKNLVKLKLMSSYNSPGESVKHEKVIWGQKDSRGRQAPKKEAFWWSRLSCWHQQHHIDKEKNS